MPENDRMALLCRVVDETSQAAVARRIGRSAAAINQILKGTYAGNPEAILELVAAHYGTDTVVCPIMGEVPMIQCIEMRDRPFRATNPMRVRLFKACATCERRTR